MSERKREREKHTMENENESRRKRGHVCVQNMLYKSYFLSSFIYDQIYFSSSTDDHFVILYMYMLFLLSLL